MARQKAIPNRITDASIILRGSEPKFSEKSTMSDVTRALGWYSAEVGPDVSRKHFLAHFPNDGLSKELPDWEYGNAGLLLRMVERGLPREMVDAYIQKKLEYLIQVSPKYELRKAEQEAKADEKPKVPVRDSILDDAMEQIDLFVDSVILKQTKPFNFDINKYKRNQVEAIRRYCQKYIDEFTGASKLEEYGISSTQEKSIIQNLQKILSVATAVTVRVRKPRKAKVVPAAKLVSKINVLSAYEGYKAVPTEKLIGAEIALIYHTKSRKVLYVTASSGGFSAKGTSITNFNNETALFKTLRKPQEQLKEIMGHAKIACRKYVENIKAVNAVFTGRLNADYIILKVW